MAAPVTHLIRRARPDEVDTVAAMWTEAGQWLAAIGSDQWQYPARTERITASIAAGECWLVERDDEPAATITLDRYADPEFWTPADDPDNALYVHRMVVLRRFAGAGLGSALLDWAGARAERDGLRWLRLDAWRTNRRLRDYYERQGFALVRVVDLPHRRSGALYQRPAGARFGAGPHLTVG
jgi:GNAT superfamily N-acetyltransferase